MTIASTTKNIEHKLLSMSNWLHWSQSKTRTHQILHKQYSHNEQKCYVNAHQTQNMHVVWMANATKQMATEKQR
jgi:hypothetical protein